ncbi:MAG: response regulator [Gemmatimonadaceae bacterium]
MTAVPRVLIVEDNELVTGAMQILFESADWHVAIANSVAAAVADGERHPAALVLLDLSLPDGDGLSLVEPLRALGSRYFVALTGRDDPETRDRCLAAGCVDVLVKPVPVRELLAKALAWRV